MLQNEIMCQKFVLTQNPLAEEEHNKLNLFFIQLLLITFYNLLPFELVRDVRRSKNFGGISIFPLHPLQGEVCTSFIYAILILFQGSKP